MFAITHYLNNMQKKTLIIISSTVIALLLGVGLYFYLHKTPTTTPIGDLFPGSGGSVDSLVPNPEEAANIRLTLESGKGLPRLYQLHKVPVSGITSFEAGKGADRTISVRYIERGLGHIYETTLSSYKESRIVNETRSKISEAIWGRGGQSVVVRSLDPNDDGVIKTRIINLGTPSINFDAEGAVVSENNFLTTEEILLPDYVPFIVAAGDGSDNIFYLENSSTATRGVNTTFKNASNTKIFSSSFTEWLPEFPNQKLITLTTKPSGDVPGHLFFLDPKTKSITKILNNINGLTTLTSRDGKLVLYSESKEQGLSFFVYNVAKKEARGIALQTLPEKCVWGLKNTTLIYCAVPKTLPVSLYPDRWYQGVVSFSDDIWEINTSTSEVRKILNPGTLGAPTLDMTNLTLSSGDEYLLFMDKNSGKPWVYRLVDEAPPVATMPTESLSAPMVTTKPTITPTVSSTTAGMTKIH